MNWTISFLVVFVIINFINIGQSMYSRGGPSTSVNKGQAKIKWARIIDWMIPIGKELSNEFLNWDKFQKTAYVYEKYKKQADNGKILNVDDIIYICEWANHAGSSVSSDYVKEMIDELSPPKHRALLEICQFIGQIQQHKWQRVIVWLISIGQTFYTHAECERWSDEEKTGFVERAYMAQAEKGNYMKTEDIKGVCEQVEPGRFVSMHEIKQIMDNLNEDQLGYLFEACKFTEKVIN